MRTHVNLNPQVSFHKPQYLVHKIKQCWKNKKVSEQCERSKDRTKHGWLVQSQNTSKKGWSVLQRLVGFRKRDERVHFSRKKAWWDHKSKGGDYKMLYKSIPKHHRCNVGLNTYIHARIHKCQLKNVTTYL